MHLTRYSKVVSRFSMSAKRGHPSFELTNDGLTIRKATDTCKWSMISSETRFIEGVHEWHVKIDTCSQYTEIMVGVCTENSDVNSWFSAKSKGYGMYAYNGDSYPSATPFIGSKNKPGDVITVILDLNARTLSIRVNGVLKGVCNRNLPQEPLYPAIVMYRAGDQVTLSHVYPD
eukprot:GEZU01015449.1.p2 GENE.GEZU01015449.1~~GEZU01015449.1.p2  ORF type:complete len:174 (+),score=27.37 GEZU01015449.1:225-746(+)